VHVPSAAAAVRCRHDDSVLHLEGRETVSDWFFRQGGSKRRIDWLRIDAWVDSTAATLWERAKDIYNGLSSYFARFRLTGWRRLANEGVSECLTIGAGGLVVLFLIAMPALNEIEDGKLVEQGKYSVKFLDIDGNEIGKRGINANDTVPLEEIPDHMIKAAMATEDRRFYEHYGVDILGVLRALSENLKAGETVQGASTFTQQLAKNMFLTPERSLQRKIKEVFYAFWLESRYSKRDILKMYLDRAYMGGGAFGVEAASQFYFGKSVREINMAEAALLAGLFKAPTKFAPHVNLPLSRARTNEVLSNMVEAGFYTEGQVHQARLYPAQTIEQRQTNSPDWFLDWAYDEVVKLMDGKNQFNVTARVTVDQALQKHAEETLATAVRQRGRSARFNSGAIVIMETDGMVRALAGGPDYGDSQFNRATRALRQPGSSFKIYVYATALERGMRPDTSVADSSPSCGNWHPQNYGGSHGSGGRMPLWLAFAKSLNTTAVALSLRYDRDNVIEMTRRVGITGIRRTCSMALGDYGITPLQHTGGVATYLNGGKRVRPFGVLEITNSRGEVLYNRERDEPEPPQIVAPQVAAHMNQLMRRVVTDGTGKSASLEFTEVVGKTGTSTGPRDVWFVGGTGKYATSVWFGNDDNRPMANGTTGGGVAAQVYHQLMVNTHGTTNIPGIPGVSAGNMQVAARAQPGDGARQDGAMGRRQQSIMPPETREALRRLAQMMRRASGMAEAPAEQDRRVPAGGAPSIPAAPDRRAEAPGARPSRQ
jgi:penicillin-binding protein 1A